MYPAYLSCLLLVFHGVAEDMILLGQRQRTCSSWHSKAALCWPWSPSPTGVTGSGRCHASSGAASQPVHTELFITNGKQACTWTTADSPEKWARWRALKNHILGKPTENVQGRLAPMAESSARTHRAQGFLELHQFTCAHRRKLHK